MKNNIKC